MLRRTHYLLAGSLLLLAVTGQSCRNAAEEPFSVTATQVDATASGISDYAVYTLQCQIGNKFLQVAGDTVQNQKYPDGALLEQAGALPAGRSGSWQQWSLVYRTSVGSTRYYQVRSVFSGKLLTSPSNTDGAQLVQQGEAATLSDQQLWQVSKVDATDSGPDRYRLLSKSNGLAVTNHDASTSDGTAITQEKLQPTYWRQRWALAQQANQSYRDDQVVRFFERNNPAQGSVAFDNGASILLSDGRVLWTTQDAYDGYQTLGPTTHLINNGKSMAYQNSVIVQPSITDWSSSALNLTDSAIAITDMWKWFGRKIFSDPNVKYLDLSGMRIWPNAGVEIGNHVYVEASETGIGAAIYDLKEKAGTAWARPKRLVPNGFATAPCGYGAGFIKSADGYVYAYGNQDWNLYVARFKPNDVRTSWEYYNATTKTWSKTPTKDGAQIGESSGNVGVTYVNGKYVAVTYDLGYACSDINARGVRSVYAVTSASPNGPFNFTADTKVFDIKEYQYGKPASVYGLHLHPEAVNGRNELLMTYSLNFNNGACAVPAPTLGGMRDPYFARVKGVRIPYSLIKGL